MKRLVKRFGKLMTASFFVMGVGAIVFLLTPVFLLWNIDTDISGALIFVIGAILCGVGSIRRVRNTKEWRGSWRERMGVEPTEDIVMPPDGFEVREAHRDLDAPPKDPLR